MSKISITELASVLMDKHGLKRTEAELFIRQLVVVVNDALKKDKVAKLKGLGTFKVQSVSARKSVDVNTGEAILIEGRDKISFTADAVMRDLVNAPFAQFETVVVNDGVDFSSIDEASEQAETQIIETSSSEPEEKPSNNDTNIISDNIKDDNSESICVSEDEPTLSQANTDDEVEHIESANENVNTENKNAVGDILSTIKDVVDTSINVKEDESQEQFCENNNKEIHSSESDAVENNSATAAYPNVLLDKSDVASEPIEAQSNFANSHSEYIPSAQNADLTNNSSDDASEMAILIKQKEELKLESDSLQETIYSYQKKVKLLTWCLIAIALIVVSGVVYTGNLLEKSNNRVEHLIAQNSNLVAKLTQINSNSTNAASSQEQDSLKSINDSISIITKQKAELATKIDEHAAIDKKNESNIYSKNQSAESNQEKPKTSVVDKNKKSDNVSSQEVYNKDPRIRTGAYVITGISQTVTIREGQTLSSISKTYLGPGMECYLEAVNGGDRKLKVGDKVKIPALKTKKSLSR